MYADAAAAQIDGTVGVVSVNVGEIATIPPPTMPDETGVISVKVEQIPPPEPGPP